MFHFSGTEQGANFFLNPYFQQQQVYTNPILSDQNQSGIGYVNQLSNTSPFNPAADFRDYKIWTGDIKMRDSSISPKIYSKKLFIGGVPPNMPEEAVTCLLQQFDPNVILLWPEAVSSSKSTPRYLRVIMSSHEAVDKLLKKCKFVVDGGCETYIHSIPVKNKRRQLQIVPWLLSDSIFCPYSITPSVLGTKYTVFVGALHGRMHASAIAKIFDDVFGDVTWVRVDTDEYEYPTGSGRVAFGNAECFKKAVLSNFIHIESRKVKKKIQIEPCIDSQVCCMCEEQNVPNFCKDLMCFDYYCNPCWLTRHQPMNGIVLQHSPIRRKSKSA